MIIGLSGYKQSGKNTVADIITKAFPHYTQKAFATKLKECTSLITGCNILDLEVEEFKNSIYKNNITYRKILQVLGTEVGRSIYADIWIDALFKDYSEGSNWVITDVRFPNEAKAIKDKGGIIIRINRPRFCEGCTMINLNSQDCFDCVVFQDDYNDFHESEIALDEYPFEYIIDNNKDLTSLQTSVIFTLFNINRTKKLEMYENL